MTRLVMTTAKEQFVIHQIQSTGDENLVYRKYCWM